MLDPNTTAAAIDHDRRKQAPTAPQRIDSRRLLSGHREIVIDHSGEQYRLRLTRNDKLILTK